MVEAYYKNKNVFLTGGSGFIGKAIIEKLLRSCPNIGNIYVLLRSKKGTTNIQDRMEKIFNDCIFDKLKDEDLEKFQTLKKKIVTIEGDISKQRLGIGDRDRQVLLKKTNIVIHTAASVRFDDALHKAILLNVRSTKDVCELLLEMKQLTMFVHVSTTYCNINETILEERLYPPLADWREAIEISENLDPYQMAVVASKYVDSYPNTYTFAKHLGEHVVNDLCNGKVPTIIIRPSIVVPSIEEPVAGWTDNFNGPIGVSIALSKGVIRALHADRNLFLSYAPVDQVVKIILSAVYIKDVKSPAEKRFELEVYNASANFISPVTLNDLETIGYRTLDHNPIKNMYLYPSCVITKSSMVFYVLSLLLHFLPALLIDRVLAVTGKKRIFAKLVRRGYIANMMLAYFLLNEWKFIHEKTMNIKNEIPSESHKAFMPLENVDSGNVIVRAASRTQEILLNEYADKSDLIQNKRLKVLHYVLKYILQAIGLYLVYLILFPTVLNMFNY